MANELLLKEIAAGESKTVEFKLELPEQSEKYIKTLVAYANTAGGKLIIGIRDEDRAIVGVSNPAIVIDAIANAMTDMVKPLIIPNIYRVDIDGKSIVVVEVFPGSNCPYYIKSKGKEGGTYVKIGATTRLADDPVLRELEFRGASQSFDEQVYIGAPYDEGKALGLCKVIERYRKESARIKGKPEPANPVTPKNLENWKILRRVDGELVPTRAFMLLTDNPFDFAKIQCGQFKGTDRIVFLDKREYAGTLYEQIEEATQFVLRNIRFGAEVIGMLRHEDYELPLTAIREAIINATIHRSYLQNSCVQVALYDDRLEVSSPGALFGDLTLEKALAGSTAVRNTRIAKAFEEMDLYESWGTGLRRIQDSCRDYGLPAPEFLEIGDMFRVNIFRAPASQPASEADAKQVVNRNGLAGDPSLLEREVLNLLTQNPRYSRKELAEKTGVSESSIYRRLTALKSVGRIEFVGTNRSGEWVIKE
jgi:predicted HTH transcriptional regulator